MQASKEHIETTLGYKETKIGAIPDAWDFVKIGEITTYIKGFAFKSKDFCQEGTRVIRVSDTSATSIKDSDPIYILESDGEIYNKWRLKQGDLVFTTVGSRPPLYDSMVGKVIRVNIAHAGALLNQNAVIIRSKESVAHQTFLYNLFKIRRYLYYIETIARGNANQVSITLDDLFSYRIPLPPLLEQQKIAQILSTWDSAIEKHQALIDEKQHLKKGLMQQLLTGKKRFPGFTEEWKEFRLADLFEIVGGGTPDTKNEKYWGGEVRWFTPAEIKDKYSKCSQRTITLEGLRNSSAKLLPKGSMLFTSRATIATVSFTMNECTTNQGFQSFLPSERNSLEYMYYWVIYNKHQFIRRSAGSTFLEISKKEIQKIKALFPSNKEQQKIASVLSTADQEIEKLQQELDEIKEQKRGLMQKLLTGEVRVKV